MPAAISVLGRMEIKITKTIKRALTFLTSVDTSKYLRTINEKKSSKAPFNIS